MMRWIWPGRMVTTLVSRTHRSSFAVCSSAYRVRKNEPSMEITTEQMKTKQVEATVVVLKATVYKLSTATPGS